MSNDDLLMELCRWRRLLKFLSQLLVLGQMRSPTKPPPTRKRQIVIDEN